MALGHEGEDQNMLSCFSFHCKFASQEGTGKVLLRKKEEGNGCQEYIRGELLWK